MLQGKITITILISTNCYTSKENYRENYRRLVYCAFLLEFCISTMKTKKTNQICSSSLLELCLLTCVTGYVDFDRHYYRVAQK